METVQNTNKVSAFTRGCYCFAIVLALFEAVFPTVMSVRPVEILLIIILAWVLLAEKRLYYPENRVSFVIAVFIIYLIFIGLIGEILISLPFSSFIRGYAPAVRIAIYSLFFWLGYHILSRDPVFFKNILAIWAISLIIQGSYGLMQFYVISFGLLPLEYMPYVPVYEFIDGRTRIVDYAATGFTDSVYTLAEYGIQVLIIGFSLMNSRLRPYWQAAFLVLLGYLMVLSTYRRSQMIAIVIVALVLVILQKSSLGRKMANMLIVTVLITLPNLFLDVIAIINQTLADRIYSIQLLLSGKTDNILLENWNGRTDGTWATYLDLAREYPFGTGLYPPNILEAGSDSSYLTHLVWGGLPLAALYALLIVIPLIYALSQLPKVKYLSGAQIISCYLMIGTSLSMLITGISGGGVLSLPSQIPFWITLSFMASQFNMGRGSRRKYQVLTGFSKPRVAEK